jgi:hypothetical protein
MRTGTGVCRYMHIKWNGIDTLSHPVQQLSCPLQPHIQFSIPKFISFFLIGQCVYLVDTIRLIFLSKISSSPFTLKQPPIPTQTIQLISISARAPTLPPIYIYDDESVPIAIEHKRVFWDTKEQVEGRVPLQTPTLVSVEK